MIEFPAYDKCKDCRLWESATCPGIPTRPLQVSGKNRALLVVGMAPGVHEDEKGVSWIGWSGQILQKFIEACRFTELVDVYLSNAVRCRVPQGQKTAKGDIKACRPKILLDIQRLSEKYNDLIILCCGADATHSVTGVSSLNDGLRMQGVHEGIEPLQIIAKHPTVFFTNHPAILHAGRKPQAVASMQDHFVLVRRYLTGDFIPNQIWVVPEIGGEPPKEFPDRLSLDIETYGIMEGVEQTVFTPAKSYHVDGIPYGQQIKTISVGHKAEKSKMSPCGIRTCVFQFNDPAQRKILYEWIRRVREPGHVLQGQNFKFDMLYMVMNDPVLDMLLDPNHVTLDDSLLWAFLLDEQRPEKSQKELALLFGITDYSKLLVTARAGRAKGVDDPNLLYYNCMDTGVQIAMTDEIIARIKMKYGENSTKLGPVCAKMRSDTLWAVIGMERAGHRMDLVKLRKVNAEYTEWVEKAQVSAGAKGVITGGEGTKASMLEFITKALKECNLMNDSRVELTEVKREISTAKANMNLVLQHLPDGELRDTALAVQEYNEYSHLRNTYTNKLLRNKRNGLTVQRFNVGEAYPTWYPVPSVFDKGGRENDEGKGGTIQGRITARNPPMQTYPKPVYKCLRSRFPGGTLRAYDFSQIELRTAALLSGCPVLLEVYNTKGRSIHMDTTLMLYPHLKGLPADTIKKEHYKIYTSCKSVNFLVLFRGGAGAYQATAMSDCGLALSLEECQQHIDRWYAQHPVFKGWQDDLIELVERTGFIELPTGWSRSFGSGRANAAGAVNEICNYPIQTIGSGQIPLSAQFAMLAAFRKQKMRSVICGQKYDSIIIDTPYDEAGEVDRLAEIYLTRPPIMDILEEKLGRTVPIEFELEIVG